MTFIHYSSNNKIYRDTDFDSVSRTGIEVKTRGGKSEYIANTLTQYKKYKTLKGAEKFMEKSGRKPIAVEDGKNLIFLNSSAEQIYRKSNKKSKNN